jgi:putative FmdB family regulatory protein
MPIYEYKCRSCGGSFEITQSMKDDPLKICPTCGKEIRRVINGGGGVIFKGSGFYVTDNSKKSAGSSGPPSEKTPAKPAEGCAGCAAAQSGACAGNSAASGVQAANS